ncbi:toxin-antitoxin system YwqK family antitoxin [Paraburkholderia fungorum]|uniref:toxin-antitoxin system YwqK family antitoxin n=1 Tax=Paraburkholderia fungorum TaxID=134537 RepID=UPI001C1E9011|nr:hypothetical protein [Paraburkholderia fungorum]MBU7435845.1 hypothetical protein [Paraburkholderia fungorum]
MKKQKMQRKYRRALLVSSLATSLLLAACSGSVLDWRNAQVNNGKIYAGDANKPFSGKVTNVPFSTIYSGQPGYQKIVGSTGTLLTALFGSPLLCDAQVDDGLPSGDIECKPAQSDFVQVKGHFDKGVMTGDFTMYDKDGKNPSLEAHYKDGQPDGEFKRYNPATGKVILDQKLSNGVADGKYQEWDPKTGNLLVNANFAQGLLDGDFIKASADGRPIMKGTYDHGKFSGIQTTYMGYQGNSESGWLIVTAEQKIENGVVTNPEDQQAATQFLGDVSGCVQRKDNENFLANNHSFTSDQIPGAITACKQEVTAKKDSEAQQATQQAAVAQPASGTEDRSSFPNESNACTDAWDAAFRKANGADAPINYDQQWEFVDNCRAGKRPQT